MGSALRVAYLVETPITKVKKMYGAQLSLVAMVREHLKHGIEAFVVVSEEWEMTRALREVGAEVFVTPIWEFFRSLDGVYDNVHEPEWQTKQTQTSRSLLTTYFAKNAIQIVHMNTRFAGLIGAEVARALGIPYIYHIREFLAEDFGLAFKDQEHASRMIEGSSAVIAISEAVLEHVRVEYPNARVERIYNGVSSEEYGRDAVTRFTVAPAQIALVGRVVEHKGQLEAVRAVEILRDRYQVAVELRVIGTRPDEVTPYEEQLYRYVDSHDLQDVVRFIPFTDDVPAEISDCDIGLMCSTKEAFGRVSIEYMYSRLLTIGSRSGGTQEIIEDGIDGFLYSPGDPLSLAEAILTAISDPTRSRQMIERAHEVAQKKFSSTANAELVRSLYHRVLS